MYPAERKKILLILAVLLLLPLLHIISLVSVQRYPEMTLTRIAQIAEENALPPQKTYPDGMELIPGKIPSAEYLPSLPEGLLDRVSIPLDSEYFTYAFYPLSGKMILLYCHDVAYGPSLLLELRVPYRSFFELNCISHIRGRVESFHIVTMSDCMLPSNSAGMLADNTVLDFFIVGNCYGNYSEESGFTGVSGLFFDERSFREVYDRYGV